MWGLWEALQADAQWFREDALLRPEEQDPLPFCLTRAVPAWYAYAMNTSKEEGTPLTIDSAGNIVPRPNGYSRWTNHRKFACKHEGCDKAAVATVVSPKAHNCCADHEHEEVVPI